MALEWILLIVALGAFAQATTGMGVGVVAGPFLLMTQGYQSGMMATSILSIIVSAACAWRARSCIDPVTSIILIAALAPGIALAWGVSSLLSTAVLLKVFGALLIALGVSSLRHALSGPASDRAAQLSQGERRTIGVAGMFAGAGGYLFCAPGPVAAWALSRTELPVAGVRATLSFYFVFSYVAVLIGFGVAAATMPVPGTTALLVLACVAGMAIGFVVGERAPPKILRLSLGALIASSGLSFLI